jgi:ribosome biogenesis GTPase A
MLTFLFKKSMADFFDILTPRSSGTRPRRETPLFESDAGSCTCTCGCNIMFSGKQKKKQLQEKRERKKKRGTSEPEKLEEKPGHTTAAGPADNQRGVQLIREIYGLRTVYAREPDEVVAARKLRGHEPLAAFQSRPEWEREVLRPLHVLGMPQRPQWTPLMSKQELDRAEETAFAEWLKGVYAQAERLCRAADGLELNFFEHNLDVWRQLWRAMEMGDVLLICTDVRWPTFTFPFALVECALAIGKPVVLTLTKADLVAPEVAREWERYFAEMFPELTVALTNAFPVVEAAEGSDRVKAKSGQRVKALKSNPESKRAILEACKAALHWEGPSEERPFFTISAVGAPNAGKSAVINLLVEAHKVAVSATPGKTKHFQTHFVSSECRLLDSPGLLFPSVGRHARVVQAIVGNYPVSQLREPFSAVAFLARRCNLPKTYGLSFPYDEEDDDGKDKGESEAREGVAHEWSAFEICEALAMKRGFRFKGGSCDVYRSGKLILAEALRGILKSVYWLPPVV